VEALFLAEGKREKGGVIFLFGGDDIYLKD